MKNCILLIIFCLTASACSTAIPVTPDKNKVSQINFFKATPPKNGELRAYPTALTAGFLTLKNNCLYLAQKKKSNENLRLLIWPWNFNLDESKQGFHILNGSQKVFAKIGGYYYFGGSGGSFKEAPVKALSKYKVCVTENVIGSWSVSPSRINDQ